jgi:hypothetical protein
MYCSSECISLFTFWQLLSYWITFTQFIIVYWCHNFLIHMKYNKIISLYVPLRINSLNSSIYNIIVLSIFFLIQFYICTSAIIFASVANLIKPKQTMKVRFFWLHFFLFTIFFLPFWYFTDPAFAMFLCVEEPFSHLRLVLLTTNSLIFFF